jgi:hypothetical protein
MENLIVHVREQLQLNEFRIVFSEEKFELVDEAGHLVYSEKIFSSLDSFLESEILELIKKSKDENYLFSSNFSYFKIWYLTTHEKYFENEITLDKYGRIGISNLREEFHQILSVPMSDILKSEIQRRLGIDKKRETEVYFTCDFDHLNIWDVWGFKDFAREVIYSLKDLKFKKLSETILSYLFSRKIARFNYHLNENMFCYDSNFKNLGFFITSERKGLDGNFDYSNVIVQNYIQRLKDKQVEFGLHTSFYTYDNPDSIVEQKAKFYSTFKQSFSINRHHYLRFIFPTYLDALEKIGVQKDFSLYFPENMLFRCGTSSRFVPWNEKENRAYHVELFPITIMDGTFTDYLFCSFEEAKKLAMNKVDLSLKYSSDLVLLWHNRSTYKNSNIKNNYHPELLQFLKTQLMKRWT